MAGSLITNINKTCLWVILTDELSSVISFCSQRKDTCFFLQIVLCVICQVNYPDLQLQHTYGSALKLAFGWNCKLLSLVQPYCFAMRKQAKIIQMLVPLQHTFYKSFQMTDLFCYSGLGKNCKISQHIESWAKTIICCLLYRSRQVREQGGHSKAHTVLQWECLA